MSPESPFQTDVPCPRCRYNLRGLRGGTCPECGTSVGPWLLQPTPENWKSPTFRATLIAGACALALGVAVLVMEVPRTYRRHQDDFIKTCIAAGGLIVIGALWFTYARRLARARRPHQALIATAMWTAVTLLMLLALAAR